MQESRAIAGKPRDAAVNSIVAITALSSRPCIAAPIAMADRHHIIVVGGHAAIDSIHSAARRGRQRGISAFSVHCTQCV